MTFAAINSYQISLVILGFVMIGYAIVNIVLISGAVWVVKDSQNNCSDSGINRFLYRDSEDNTPMGDFGPLPDGCRRPDELDIETIEAMGGQIKQISCELKTWPEYFQDQWTGMKRFELRKNDRDFRVGQFVLLREYRPDYTSIDTGSGYSESVSTGTYTGRAIAIEITYLMEANCEFGLDFGWVIFGYRILARFLDFLPEEPLAKE